MKITRFLSQLLKSIWLFFPGILFLLFPIACFWILGQGKDIIVAFTQNENGNLSAIHFNYTPLLFFTAIAFWVYVSWYSSRIISYIKKFRQKEDIKKACPAMREETAEAAYNNEQPYFETGKVFLDEFPRMIGNGCLLVLELAVLQSPVLDNTIGTTMAWVLFFILLICLRYINKWISGSQSMKAGFSKTFFGLLWLFIILLLMLGFVLCSAPPNIHAMTWLLFSLLIFFHILFVYFINLRRNDMEMNADKMVLKMQRRPASFMVKLMEYLCIPLKETGYFKWFQRIGFFGIAFYIAGIFSLWFARNMGPFPFIILAFGVLLGYANIVVALSVRYKINFHFLIFVFALVIGSRETHWVTTRQFPAAAIPYRERPDLKKYLRVWLKEHLPDSGRYDMYFVMANGGASRSGYWTASVLGKIEDSSLLKKNNDRFSNHIFCLSGTSGGGVGVATFFSLLRDNKASKNPFYANSAKAFLRQDYFTYTFARMLGPDFFKYIFPFQGIEDRAAALEYSFEKSAKDSPTDTTYQVPFDDNLSMFPALKKDQSFNLPILFVNTTRMQDGNPGVVTNLSLDSTFNSRVDVVTLLDPQQDISIASGSILGARFPYLSPAGRIGDSYFVDGGYFDNSGAGVVQEMIRGILNIAKQDSMLSAQIARLDFKVLHIVNSPVGFDSVNIKKNIKAVAPVKNDLLSPALTIIGAYDMQTTVNDNRLTNFLEDINKGGINHAGYQMISLYESPQEWRANPLYDHYKKKGEPSYAMNWFMSDTTLQRIDKRLNKNPALDSFIRNMRR